MLFALITKERGQERISEQQLIEPCRQTIHRRTTPSKFVQATHSDTHQIGTVRFELTTPRSQSECATRLRHVPLWIELLRSLDSRDCAETLDLANCCQLAKSLDLDLPNALARQTELATDFVERAWIETIKPITQLEDATMPLREGAETFLQSLA